MATTGSPAVDVESSLVNSDLDQLLTQREVQCRIEQWALEQWLGLLTPFRWLTVGGGTLLSTVAGATVLAKPEAFGTHWPLIGGLCALAASILTGLHTALKCEAHQAECGRLIQVYSALEAAYQAAHVLPPAQRFARQEALESRFEEAKTKATASAPSRYRKRGEMEAMRSKS